MCFQFPGRFQYAKYHLPLTQYPALWIQEGKGECSRKIAGWAVKTGASNQPLSEVTTSANHTDQIL